MIRSWRLERFKSVLNHTELEFRPITVFAGSNSSGKSTWLQSILMVGQTINSRLDSYAVLLNGRFVKLGQYKDVKSFDATVNNIAVGWELDLSSDDGVQRLTGCQICFDPDSGGSELGQLSPRLLGTKVELTYTGFDGEAGPHFWIDARLEDPMLEPEPKETLETARQNPISELRRRRYSVALDPSSRAQLHDELADSLITNCRLGHFLPKQIVVDFDAKAEAVRLLGRSLVELQFLRVPRQLSQFPLRIPTQVIEEISNSVPENYRDIFRGSLPVGEDVPFVEWQKRIRTLNITSRMNLRKILQTKEDRIQLLLKLHLKLERSQTIWEIPNPDLMDAISSMERWFKNLFRYLGPLRDEPKTIYPLSDSDDPTDVGLRGEHTAAVLHLHRDLLVSYISPNAFRDGRLDENPPTQFTTLRNAVDEWLSYLGVGESVETSDLGRQGHRVDIRLRDLVCRHDLTHVGVGVSQVLPILVMCLVAPVGATLIFEQPELHLHPAVQARLGDFFLSLAFLGVQCVIETHSEYLINRFRYRVAASRADVVSSQLSLYFVEKQNGYSVFREVEVNTYGSMPDWPVGFFDQTPLEIEEIFLAANRKKRSEDVLRAQR